MSLITGSLFVLLLGSVPWGFFLGLLVMMVWQLRYLYRLIMWLEAGLRDEPPDLPGAWAKMVDRIYQLKQKHTQSQTQLRHALRRIRQSTSALQEGIVMLDAQGNLEWWNPSARQLLGLRRPHDLGMPIINLLRNPSFVRYFHQRHYAEPIELTSPLDRQHRLMFSIAEFGRSDRLLVVRDVTRIHQLEVMRQGFIGNVSHELKTPITIIQGYLETFLSQLGEQPPHLAKAMYRMLLQTQRMSELVNDFLTLLKLETSDQANNLQSIDIGQMLVELRQGAQELCNRQKKQQDITIEIASPAWLIANEQEIFSAFSNLVYNAVKYTTETGTVYLRWWTDDVGGYFAVSDTGIGIAAHHLSRLTERFYRVDQSRARSSGGTGLGLAIVKHVLKRHHAHLKIQSTPGQGSVFTCHFPLQAIAKSQRD